VRLKTIKDKSPTLLAAPFLRSSSSLSSSRILALVGPVVVEL
jgi:hypothetical protein